MLLGTDGRLGAIGVCREHLGVHGLEQLALVLGDADVVLLIHGLQLGVETADDHILEPVGLDACPAVHLVGGDVLGIAGDVGAGIGVGALAADACHQFVILVGDVVLGCQLRDAVDLVVQHAATLGILHEAILLVAGLDGVEKGLLGGIVACAVLLGALEHQVLQVMGQTGGLGRIVARTGAHGDMGRDARALVVLAEEDLKAVAQGVTLCSHRVTRDGGGHGLLGSHAQACEGRQQ